MRRLIVITCAVMFLALAANAQVRGTGRLQGNVFDKKTGQPIAGATVTIALPKGATAPIVVKTDSKGHWAALGMTPGVWYIDITAPEGEQAGKTSKGIYHLEGDTLKMCYAVPDKDRPKDFESKPGSGLTLVIWKRSK